MTHLKYLSGNYVPHECELRDGHVLWLAIGGVVGRSWAGIEINCLSRRLARTWRRPPEPEVAGSNPAPPAKLILPYVELARLAFV